MAKKRLKLKKKIPSVPYNKKEEKSKKKTQQIEIVEKMFVTGVAERVIRWAYMIAFLLVLVTHVDILFQSILIVPEGEDSGQKLVLMMHLYCLYIYAAAIIALMIKYLPASIILESYDFEWLRKLGGYARKYSPVPPAGRYNAGQKVNYLLVFVLGVLYVLTGVVAQYPMYFSKSLVMASYSLHTFLLLAIIVITLLHIYLQYIVTPARIGTIWSGQMPKKFLELHHSVWYEEALASSNLRQEADRRRREKHLEVEKSRISKIMAKRKKKITAAKSKSEQPAVLFTPVTHDSGDVEAIEAKPLEFQDEISFEKVLEEDGMVELQPDEDAEDTEESKEGEESDSEEDDVSEESEDDEELNEDEEESEEDEENEESEEDENEEDYDEPDSEEIDSDEESEDEENDSEEIDESEEESEKDKK
ncbi:MAG: cytochrome b/b6 domain-containing protein [Planctomycetota bacterium]